MASTSLTDGEDTPALTALSFDPISTSENGGGSMLSATQSGLSAAV